MTKLLPIGVENFEDFSRQNYYYIDKTMFIAELLYNRGKVNLFTRPRRFGKTLMMSMLRTFFEIGRDQSMFDGLNIFQEKELCGQNVDMFFFRFCKGNIIEKIKANEEKIKKISGVLFIDIECKGCDLWRLPIF